MNNEILIPIDAIKNDFEHFLNIEENSRVFFSGKFGIGKTYFLNNFFNSKKDEYETFHLYPINYQISSNEDILELIKYDLLVEIVKRSPTILQENSNNGIKDSTLLFYSWCKNKFSINSILKNTLNITNLISELPIDPTIGLLGKLGRPLQDLLEIDKEFQLFKKEYQEGEKGQAEKYLQVIRDKNISAVDYISHLLKEKIEKIKDKKKSILIIDDLDRIDPEHIFKLLNIFSAYFEKEHENKFGFDKIIIVADYTNLKSIFHHKYGSQTDFSGYMDKFFSISPYYFDNKKATLDMIDQISKSIKNEDSNLSSAIGDGGYIKLFVRYLFAKNIEAETINLRQLLKPTKYLLSEFKKGSFHEDPFSDNFLKIFDKAIKTIVNSFSSSDIFIENLEKIKFVEIPDYVNIRTPFGKYINSMLISLGTKPPSNEVNVVDWGEYSIKKDPSGLDFFVVEKGNIEHLFIDLLIQYIKNKKYQKSNYRDYDN
jgi:hypothetical protein